MTDIQRNLALGFGVLLVGGIVVYLLAGGKVALPGTQSSIGTTTNVGGGINATGDYTVDLVGTPPPALSPIVITGDLSAEAKRILRQKIDAQYEILVKEPTRVDVWLLLGTNRKIGSDFKGAIEAWNYVAAVAPTAMVATARANLGDLYMFFLKDYDKAEVNLKAAIAANPSIIEPYRNLFYLYRDIRKDKTAASAILEQGIKANPENPDLKALRAQL